MRRPASAVPWLVVCLSLAGGCALSAAMPAEWLDWQPARAISEPWRFFTAAFVHGSPRHLAVNAAGLALVAWLGIAAKADGRTALAWFAAWPATHAALGFEPQLVHYGGLSGVLHAGVAAAAVAACRSPLVRHRLVGAGLIAGLALKIAIEAPWDHVLRASGNVDVPVAPLAHLAGALLGTAFALIASAQSRLERPPMKDAPDG